MAENENLPLSPSQAEPEALTLDKVPIGSTVRVIKVNGEGKIRRRLFDMGVTPDAEIYLRKVAPLGDPLEVTLRGYELTLRLSEAQHAEVEVLVQGNAQPDEESAEKDSKEAKSNGK